MPPPSTALERNVVTFVDFAGPVSALATAQHFGLASKDVEPVLIKLRAQGYLKYGPVDTHEFESRGRWSPDEGVGGAYSEPHAPSR